MSLIETLAGLVLVLTSAMVLFVVWEADRPTRAEKPPRKKPVVHEVPERRAA